jgi:hypothetical protein
MGWSRRPVLTPETLQLYGRHLPGCLIVRPHVLPPEARHRAGTRHVYLDVNRPDLLLRRSRHIVQDPPLRSVRWADIPALPARDRRCPAAWQQ